MARIPNPIPPANNTKMDPVIGTLVGAQLGLFGGHGSGAPLPLPGCAILVKEATKNNKVKTIENNFALI